MMEEVAPDHRLPSPDYTVERGGLRWVPMFKGEMLYAGTAFAPTYLHEHAAIGACWTHSARER